MTVSTLHAHGLTLPEALMPFLHSATGQPYHPARSGALAAAAEVAELVVLGHAEVVDGAVRVTGGRTGGVPAGAAERPWVAEVTETLATRGPTPVRTWVRARRGALAVQQDAAVERGLLTRGRLRLLGLGYARLDVDTDRRDAIVADLLSTGDDERSLALARLLVRSGLHHRNGLDAGQRRALTVLSDRADDLHVPALDAMDVALATLALTTVLGA